MAEELIYTSARRGLRPGTRGYCTVAYTRGMKPETVRVLESLSAYKAPNTRTAAPPVGFSHHRVPLGGFGVSILSRVGPAAADHTNRDNKIAHHVMLDAAERPEAGPAWLCRQPGFFTTAWTSAPQQLPRRTTIPEGRSVRRPAAAWAAAAGDAGWAAVLAHTFLSRPGTLAYVIAAAGTDCLELTAEALELLPSARRWHVTFSTYFTRLPAGGSCLWRWCRPDAACLRDARRNARNLIIDLTGPLGDAPENPLSECARNGAPLPLPRRRTRRAADGKPPPLERRHEGERSA